MKLLQQHAKNRIRDTMCRLCIYRQENGDCGIHGECKCPILANIGKIIDIVRKTRSRITGLDVHRMREAICSECAMKKTQGHCQLRDRAACALDGYFDLIGQSEEQELAMNNT